LAVALRALEVGEGGGTETLRAVMATATP